MLQRSLCDGGGGDCVHAATAAATKYSSKWQEMAGQRALRLCDIGLSRSYCLF